MWYLCAHSVNLQSIDISFVIENRDQSITIGIGWSSIININHLMLIGVDWYRLSSIIDFIVWIPQVIKACLPSFSSPEPVLLLVSTRNRELWASPRFTDFTSKITNPIGWEYETNTLRLLKNGIRPARGRDSWFWLIWDRWAPLFQDCLQTQEAR